MAGKFHLGTGEAAETIDAAALVDKMTAQAAEIERLKATIKGNEAEIKNIARERDQALLFDAKNVELREEIERLKTEIGSLRGRLKASEDDHKSLLQSYKVLGDDIESRRAEFDGIIKQFKDFCDLPAIFQAVRNEIKEEIKIRQEAKAARKSDLRYYCEQIMYVIVFAVVCFGLSFAGTRYGLPDEIEETATTANHILYNQVYMNYDRAPIKYFMPSGDASKIIQNQKQYEDQQKRAAQEAAQGDENE